MSVPQGSETSANYNLTPGKYPKEHILDYIGLGMYRELLIDLLRRYAIVVDHLAVRDVVQVAPLGGGSTSYPIIQWDRV